MSSSVFGLSSALSTLSTIVGGLMSNKTPLDIAGEVNKKYDLIVSNGSITKLLSKYIVEPVIFATYDAKESEVFDQVVNLNVDIFTSFYMQAFQILTNQMGVDANQAITLLSTDSSPFGPQEALDIGLKVAGKQAAAVGVQGAALVATENFNYLEAINNPKNRFLKVSNEWVRPLPEDEEEEKKEAEIRTRTNDAELDRLRNNPSNAKPTYSNKIGTDYTMNDIDKHPLYAVQTRSLNIETYINTGVKETSRTIVIPIIIKAHIICLGVQEIINALKPNSATKTFMYRLDEWRAGAISFRDLLFCSDLIREYKDVKKKDKNSIIELINGRNLNANATTILNGGKGFESNYNMVICTTNDKVKIDKAMNGDITKEAVKQNFLADLHSIGCSILDEDYERLTVLIKDIRSKSDVGYRNLLKRKQNDAIQDMIKMTQSLLMNKQLTF